PYAYLGVRSRSREHRHAAVLTTGIRGLLDTDQLLHGNSRTELIVLIPVSDDAGLFTVGNRQSRLTGKEVVSHVDARSTSTSDQLQVEDFADDNAIPQQIAATEQGVILAAFHRLTVGL